MNVQQTLEEAFTDLCGGNTAMGKLAAAGRRVHPGLSTWPPAGEQLQESATTSSVEDACRALEQVGGPAARRIVAEVRLIEQRRERLVRKEGADVFKRPAPAGLVSLQESLTRLGLSAREVETAIRGRGR